MGGQFWVSNCAPIRIRTIITQIQGIDTERAKQQGDLTCESGNAYLHANYVTRRGKRVESAPHTPDSERARKERHSRHKRETRTTSD